MRISVHRRDDRAMTLVELMVVIVVIGLLLSVAVPQMVGARSRSQDGATKANLRTVLTAAGIHASANAGQWPDHASLASQEGSISFVADSVDSTGPGVVSVVGGTTFAAAARSQSGTCWTVTTSSMSAPQWSTRTGPCRAGIGGVVVTLAGSGSSGYLNATGTAAAFNWPRGVAVDSAGNVFVADRFNHRIRKVTPAGVVTTFAGSGAAGFADGTGTEASFNAPGDVAIDAADTLYVADVTNHRIRKITSAGVVTTLPGSGSAAYADGTGTAASFNQPWSLALDSSGNLFVVDYLNTRIRKVTQSGAVTTFAGSGTNGYADGTGTAASFWAPRGVGIDASDNLYIADYTNHRIRKITPAAVVTTLAGSGSPAYADGTGSAASFNGPVGIAVDGSGNVIVTEDVSPRIRKVTSAGVVTTLAGSGAEAFTDGIGTAAEFWLPSDAIVWSGQIYVADTMNHAIRKIT